MNETIGVKGGKNDYRRSLRITKQFKEKLEVYQKEQYEKELHELEKKVNLIQKVTFIKTVPIVITGQIYQTLTENTAKKKQLVLQEVTYRIEQENAFSEREKQAIITALKNNNLFSLNDGLLGKLGISRSAYKQVSELDLTDFTIEKASQIVSENTKEAVLKVATLEQPQKEFSQEKTETDIATVDPFSEQLDKLKNHKIVDEYENKLKEVRKELRQLIFEYNLIADESDNIYDSKEAEDLLDRLNSIIKKVETLKQALAVPDVDKYDANYLYTLIEDYMESFNNQNFVSEIKDSNLYIMISNKLTELDTKKDKLQTKIETRKEVLEIDEDRLEDLKERYFDFEKFNRDLLNFQSLQDSLLDEITRKMNEATTIKERVEVQVQGMTRQSRRLMSMLGASMLLPGARSARSVATLTATYLYFMRNVLNPRTVTRRYKVVNTTDFHKEIESSLSQLDDVSTLLKKTSRQLDRTIKEIEKEFAEYIDTIPECKALLQNLEKVKDEIKEKDYELKRIKEEQEKNLEKNDAKVKKLNYEVAV